jgi:hypothetical protein
LVPEIEGYFFEVGVEVDDEPVLSVFEAFLGGLPGGGDEVVLG